MLEGLVHLEIDREDIPNNMQLLRIELPEGVSQAQAPELPEGWTADIPATRALGNRFLDECADLLLPVPSAIMPDTTHYLFNPRHPDAQAARVQASRFVLDPRLF